MSTPLPSSDSDSRKISPAAILFFVLVVPALITYVMATGNEFRQAAVFVGLLVGGVILARPFWGLLLFIALVYVRPEESLVELQGLRLPLLVALTTLVATIFHKLVNRERFVLTPLGGMMVCFGITAVISGALVGMGSVAAQDFGRLVVLVLLMLNLVTNEKRYQQIAATILLFTAYLAIYSIYLYFAGSALNEDGLLRSKATGIFSDPNDIAGTIVAGLGLSLFRIRSAPKGWKYFYAALSLILTIAIFFTHSRGGLLALLMVIGSYLVISFRPQKAIFIASIIGPILLFGLASGHMTNFNSGDASANSRFWFWSNGVEHFIQKPIFGIGYKGFLDINDGMTAHNSFVLCFTELGFIGYFFWMSCIYLAFRKLYLPITISKSDKYVSDIQASRVALAGFLMASFWISRTYVPILYLLISLPVILRNNNVEPSIDESRVLKIDEFGKIFLICTGSIVTIYILALRLR